MSSIEMPKKRNIKICLLVLFIIYLFFVLLVTGIDSIYFWQRPSLEKVSLIVFDSYGSIGYRLNIILFIPLGFLIPIIWKEERKICRIALRGFMFSLIIELLQIFCGRITDIDDLIANTIGCIIGYLIFKVIFSFKKRKNEENNQEKDNIIGNTPVIWMLIALFSYLIIYH